MCCSIMKQIGKKHPKEKKSKPPTTTEPSLQGSGEKRDHVIIPIEFEHNEDEFEAEYDL